MENYTTIKTIGKGAFGNVKLVERNIDGKLLAIKKIDLFLNEKLKTENEIQIL